MTPRRSALLATLLLTFTAAAGCLGGDPPPAPVVPTSTDDGDEPPVAPDGRGEIAAFRETNRTESGLGGVDHRHDYWAGRDRVDIFSDDVSVAPIPLVADGEPAVATSNPFLPPPPGLVYEGAAQVEVLVADPRLEGRVGLPYPFAGLHLRYLTAKDGATAWRDGGAVTIGTPVAIPVARDETDMPHSVASLWAFQLVSDGPHTFLVNVTVTAVRGNDVVEWPGHPDFYAERHRRVVFDADAFTKKTGVADILLTGDATNWNHPEKLISWGTTEVHVFANVTRAETPGGAPPADFFLEFHNASTPASSFIRVNDVDGNNDLKSYHFKIEVDPNAMDSPYATSSRWGFRLLAVYTDQEVAGRSLRLCPGCFPYSIDYHMTIVAYGASTATEADE